MEPEHIDTLRIENICAEPAFEELLETTIDTCLSSPDVFDRNLDIVQQRRSNLETDPIITKLGLWGAKKYIEQTQEADPEDPNIDAEITLPIAHSTQDKIEAFGKSLLEEALYCLSEEAAAKAEELKRAKTRQDQQDLINWLVYRLQDIQADSYAIEGETSAPGNMNSAESYRDPSSRDFYHPARLSPKLIGQYPNINIDTTCLGYSILAAAFFEKAGFSYLHAGTNFTSDAIAREVQQFTALAVGVKLDEWQIDYPEAVGEQLRQAYWSNLRSLENNLGYHAAVLVRFRNDFWLQLDNGVIQSVGGISADKLNHTEQLLDSLGWAGRGIEVNVNLGESNRPTHFWQAAQDFMKDSQEVEIIDRFLQNLSSNPQIMAAIIQEIYQPTLNRTDLFGDALDAYCYCLGIDKDEYLSHKITDTIFKYVFPDAKNEDLLPCIERCQTDPYYRWRRATDLKMAPLYTVLSLQSDYCQEVIDNQVGTPHHLLALGKPAYRIGAAVLSDFATYFDSSLPLSFWMTYWPNSISLAEHGHARFNQSAAQDWLAQRVAKQLLDYGTELRYPWHISIIENILEQGGGEHTAEG